MATYSPLEWPSSFTIGNGANGSLVSPLDLGGNWEALQVVCENCDNIPSTTTLGIQVDFSGNGTMVDLYLPDTPATKFTSGNLPTTPVSLSFLLTHAKGVRRIRFILSNNASGGSVVFKVYPLGPMFDSFGA